VIAYPHRVPSPRPTPSRRAATLTRRTALLGAVGSTTLACSPYELQTQRRRRPVRPTPSTAEAPATDPDVELATTVVAAERALLDRIDATVRRHPRLERLLAATREVHDAHVTLLEDAVPEESGASEPGTDASDAASPSDLASPTDVPSVPAVVPRDRARALRAVAAAEDDLSLTAKQAAFSAESGAFARVLASMAAAAAQQSAVLRTTRVGGGRR
jgi:hypothetical protein